MSDPTRTEDAIARTRAGSLRGARGDGITVFKGVPYGASTAGQRRWAAPAPPEPWSGVRDALAYGARTPQRVDPLIDVLYGGETTPTGEDCLVLNVWTPGVADGARRPVMVWFHGGGFSMGSGSPPLYDGANLARQGDVVVVTLNHRLNVFGFLYLAQLAGDACADSGNAGMLDLVRALEWVRDNIAEFGGDPGNVTVFGESGGGAKVCVLMAMPAARGLFQRAVVQSGVHLHAWSPAAATSNAEKLIAALGVAPGDLAKLRELEPARILDAYAAVAPQPFDPVAFSPVADGRSLLREPWKPDAPAVSAHVPLLVSSTRTETTLLSGGRDPSLFALDWAGLRAKLRPWLSREQIEPIASAFRALHPNASPSEIFFAITSDLYARMPGFQLADLKSDQGGAPVYMCELYWDTPVDGGKWGSPHGLDIPLVFANAGRMRTMAGRSPAALRVAEQMSSAWLAFARGGDPNCAELPKWPAWTRAQPQTLLFDVESRVEADWRAGERRALLQVPLRETSR